MNEDEIESSGHQVFELYAESIHNIKDESKTDNDELIINSRILQNKLSAGLVSPNPTLGQSNLEAKRNSCTKIQLTWKNISIVAPPKRRLCRKLSHDAKGFNILDNVSGTVKPGEFCAIIGASGKSPLNLLGAGKTTLLNYLSGKDPSRKLEKSGEVLINGVQRDKIKFKRYIAYVQQDDVLSQCLTVRECIEFAAKMKLHPSEDICKRVDDIISSLKLDKAANTKIGGSLVKGVSGGERKRTSIGVELITDPNMIFLDEPTTGLDSFTANTIVKVMRNLAESGRTIICTIHQPNSETFDCFDRLMLLAAGKIVYLNKANLAVDFFKSIGFPCPNQTNPADFFMEIISIESYEDLDNTEQKVVKWKQAEIQNKYREKICFMHERFEISEYKTNIDELHPDANGFSEAKENKYHSPIPKQLYYLFIRAIKSNFRLPLTSYLRALSYFVTSIFIILVFGQLGVDQQSIQSRNGILFMVLTIIIMNSIQGVIVIFPDEKPVFIREQGENLYSVTAYFVSKLASEIPMMIINTNIITLIVYFICKLNTNDASHFFIFYGYSYLLMWNSIGLGLLGGAFVKDKNMGVTASTSLVILFMLFAGFFSLNNSLLYISLYKWAYQVYVLNEYDGLILSCSPSCNPLQSLGFKETMNESIWATSIVGVCYFTLAYIVLQIKAYLAKR